MFTGEVNLSDCCPCPTNRDSWLTYVGKRDRSCPSGSCRVFLTGINFPENITCYNNYMIEYPNQTMSGILNLEMNPPWTKSFCIGSGSSTFRIFLLKGSYPGVDDCIISKTVSCDSTVVEVDTTTSICPLDCPEAWSIESSRFYTLSNGCNIRVYYRSRIACPPSNYQDLQVTKIIYFNNNCLSLTEKELYQKAVYRLIEEDPMGFNPRPKTIGCFDTWRIMNASCWKTELMGGPFGETVIVKIMCKDSNCCIQRYMVCRDSTQTPSLNIVPIGNPIIPNPINCSVLPDQLTNKMPWVYFQGCHTTCDWLQMEHYWDPITMKTSLNGTIENFKGLLVLNQGSVLFNCPKSTCKIQIDIFNLLGQSIYSFNESSGEATKEIDISNVINTKGLFFYRIYIDGVLAGTGKIIK